VSAPVDRRFLALWVAAGLAAGLVFFWFGWVGPPWSRATGITFCAFRRVTGIPCPGCGMTRAMAELAHGHLLAALHLHPFSPLVLLEGASLWGGVGLSLVRARPLALPPRLFERLIVWQGAAFLALWLGRLATGTLPW
jgi:hypothetical protein